MAHFRRAKLRKRGNAWLLDYTNHQGIRHRTSAGKDRQDAERLKIRVNDWLLEGKNPEDELDRLVHSATKRSMTFEMFFVEFLRRHGPYLRPSTEERYRNSFNALKRCTQLRVMPINHISMPVMYEYIDLRMTQDKVKVATAIRDVMLVSTMLSWAVKWGLLERNPLLGFDKPKEGGLGEVRTTPEEIGSLVQAVPMAVANIVEFGVYSGFRKEEMLGLRIENVHFHSQHSLVDVRVVTKGGRIATRTIGGPAVETLRRVIGKRITGYVFCKAGSQDRYSRYGLDSFGRAVRRLRIMVEMDGQPSYLRIHDLRHITATWGERSGIPRDRMQTILGHRTRAMTDRYTADDRIGAAIAMEALPKIRKVG